jgi:aminopeptidase N
MSQAAGVDLDWFFRQSLAQPGYPILAIKWKHAGQKLSLDIVQTQKPEWGTYRIPKLEFLVDEKLVRIDVTGRQSSHTVDGIGRRPKRIEVDPNTRWLLKSAVGGQK